MRELEVKSKLESLIARCERNGEPRLPSERRLAVELNASRPTVSKAISQLTAEGVLVRKQGSGTYIRSMRPRYSDVCLGVAFRYIYSVSDCHFLKIVNSIAEWRAEKKVSLQIYDGIEQGGGGRIRAIEAYEARLVDGFILASRMRTETIVNFNRRLPVVVLNSTVGDGDVTCVDCDYFTAGHLAAEYLVRKGHTNLGYAHCDLDHPQVARNLSGMRNALRATGLELRDEDILETDYEEADFRKNVLEFFSQRSVTAVLVGNDRWAAKLIGVLQEMGKDVPGDVSVVGIGNYQVGMSSPIALTTIDNRLDVMSSIAADLLLRKIRGEEIDKHVILLEPTLVEGQTVCER